MITTIYIFHIYIYTFLYVYMCSFHNQNVYDWPPLKIQGQIPIKTLQIEWEEQG